MNEKSLGADAAAVDEAGAIVPASPASHVAEIVRHVETLKALLGPEHETDEEAPAIPYCNWCHQSKPWHAVNCEWIAGTTALMALRNELERQFGRSR